MQSTYSSKSNPYQSSSLFSSASRNPTSSLLSASQQGRGISFLQSKAAPAKKPTVPKTSYQKTIPASGMGSQYAINSTMTPQQRQAATAKVKQPARTPRTTINTAEERQPSAPRITMDDIFALSEKFNTNQKNRLEEAAQNSSNIEVGNIRDSYDRANQELRDQIPFLQKQHDMTKEELLAAAEDVRKSGLIQKDATEETYGNSLRQGAQLNREENRRIENRMASLGTYDSSQTRDQLINQSEEFKRGQQQTLREKSREIAKIEATVAESERQAKLLVQQEVMNFQENMRKIQSAINMNDADKEGLVREALGRLQATMAEIGNQVETQKYNLAVAKQEFAMEQQKLEMQQPGYGLSQEFITTGQPSNAQEEYIYSTAQNIAQNVINGFSKLEDIENPTVKAIAEQIVSQSGATAGGAGKMNDKQRMADAALTTLSGIFDYVQNTDIRRAVNPLNQERKQYDNMRNLLIEDIGRLQTGAVINAEEAKNFRKLLPNPMESRETAMQKLEMLRQNLETKRGTAATSMPSLDEIFGYTN